MRSRVKPKARPHRNSRIDFKNYNDDEYVDQCMATFIEAIWSSAPGDSCFFLATTDPCGSNWRDHVIDASDITSSLDRFFRKYSRWDNNLFYCPNPFSTDRRKKEFACPTRLGWCDMDASDPENYDPPANVVWETSPQRFQAIWIWDKILSVRKAEKYSKAVAYRHGGDKNGWSVTKLLRPPGSVNHKPQYEEPFVNLVSCNWAPIASRPRPLEGNNQYRFTNLAGIDADPDKHPSNAVLSRYRKKLHPKVRALIRDKKTYERDRSAQIFHITAGLYEAGASPDEIASVLWHNPYFISKHGQNQNKLDQELSRILSKIGGAS